VRQHAAIGNGSGDGEDSIVALAVRCHENHFLCLDCRQASRPKAGSLASDYHCFIAPIAWRRLWRHRS
jgi:hypothetical protein